MSTGKYTADELLEEWYKGAEAELMTAYKPAKGIARKPMRLQLRKRKIIKKRGYSVE